MIDYSYRKPPEGGGCLDTALTFGFIVFVLGIIISIIPINYETSDEDKIDSLEAIAEKVDYLEMDHEYVYVLEENDDTLILHSDLKCHKMKSWKNNKLIYLEKISADSMKTLCKYQKCYCAVIFEVECNIVKNIWKTLKRYLNRTLSIDRNSWRNMLTYLFALRVG